jgi:hypothetical protein
VDPTVFWNLTFLSYNLEANLSFLTLSQTRLLDNANNFIPFDPSPTPAPALSLTLLAEVSTRITSSRIFLASASCGILLMMTLPSSSPSSY